MEQISNDKWTMRVIFPDHSEKVYESEPIKDIGKIKVSQDDNGRVVIQEGVHGIE